MKNNSLCFLIIMVSSQLLYAQNKADITAVTKAGGVPKTTTVTDGRKIRVDAGVILLKFDLSVPTLSAGQKLIVECMGAALAPGINNEYTDGSATKTFTYTADIANKQITVRLNDGTPVVRSFLTFTFARGATEQAVAGSASPGLSDPLTVPLQNYLNLLLAYYKQTSFGFVDPNSEEEAVHIFFNQYGNSLLGTVPQGIANKQYIVHVIYMGYSDKPDDVDYSVKQKTGTFNSGLVFNNTGILNNVTNFQAAVEKGYDQWHEKTFVLGTASDDLTFDIIATTEDDDGKPSKLVLDTHTIKMSPVYHGSFDIGLLNTHLSSPAFALVTDPNNADQSIVKETDAGSHGVVTVMATLYTSPVIVIEKLLSNWGWTKKKIPTYKLTGRNFLDDHRLLERIYPAIGVSIDSKAFENLFFGLNWEIARGLSIFGGKHYGKVNTFDKPGFVAGSTPVTQSEFDFYSNTKWKTDWAFGVNLDVLIVTNLFKK